MSSLLGTRDWQEISRWIGPTLDQQTAYAIGAGAYNTTTFQVGSFESVTLICKPTGGSITATFTSTLSDGPPGLQVVQVVSFAAGAVGFHTVPNVGDQVQVKLQGSIAGETVDFALVETNAGGTLASAGSGVELAYVQVVADVNVPANPEATATAFLTTPTLTFDGATACLFEFFSYRMLGGGGLGNTMGVNLFFAGVDQGRMSYLVSSGGEVFRDGVYAMRVTPAAGSYSCSLRHWQVGGGVGPLIGAGPGGAGNPPPAFFRISTIAV